jgi:SAM-dependent methyltransferase
MPVQQLALEEPVTEHNFDEQCYLAANPDVAAAVKSGQMPSGWFHFQHYGYRESRRVQCSASLLQALKLQKLTQIKPLLRQDLSYIETETSYNFLTPSLRQEFKIVDTDAVSSHSYSADIQALIQRHADGLVLDCGAGKRPIYYSNVVNFEIVAYATTDVVGVGEVLPFQDNSFDAVISATVLEHVKNPFRCAEEMIRVLKPGGELYCSVPFLQPLHGYPHHYYNMSHQVLRNLFEDKLEIVQQKINQHGLPIWTLSWFLNSWVQGLQGETKAAFLQKTVADLIQQPATYLNEPFVTELSEAKNFELASVTALFARKPK